MEKNNNALFYTCSLIEYIARKTYNRRSDIVDYLKTDLNSIYSYADVFHCEPIEKVADDFITRNRIGQGNYDNLSDCEYAVPDYWDIGEVFERLREYLTDYQKINNCGKVTLDNVRKNLSSFFSWLESEDYIVKSPIRRIHKVRTGTTVKETFSDENIEVLRDGCTEIRDLAILDLLYSTGMRVGDGYGKIRLKLEQTQ